MSRIGLWPVNQSSKHEEDFLYLLLSHFQIRKNYGPSHCFLSTQIHIEYDLSLNEKHQPFEPNFFIGRISPFFNTLLSPLSQVSSCEVRLLLEVIVSTSSWEWTNNTHLTTVSNRDYSALRTTSVGLERDSSHSWSQVFQLVLQTKCITIIWYSSLYLRHWSIFT